MRLLERSVEGSPSTLGASPSDGGGEGRDGGAAVTEALGQGDWQARETRVAVGVRTRRIT